MEMNRCILISIKLILIAAIFFTSLSCSSGISPGKSNSITVAWSPFESTALVWIAEDQQFFKQNGLDVTFRKYDTGVGSLDAVMNDEADIAVGTNEFPLVGRALHKARIRTVGSIAKSEFIYIVGRKDRGIEKATDLRGKRIGTTFRTIAEFYLGRFLQVNGMKMQDVTLVDLKTPPEWVDAVLSGDIDAVATAQPYANLARDRLGGNAIVWSAQSRQPLYTQVIATDDWITKHPDAVRGFLKSLSRAEEYVIFNPAEAKAIVQKRLNLDAGYMETVWSQNQFSLSLDQSLIIAMEDEARWMINNGLTTEKTVPDFLKYIYIDGLKAIKPGAVNIIR